MNKYSLLLFDLFKKRKTAYFLKEFKKFKNASPEEVQAYQFEKLKTLLSHAEKNVPFYQKRFKEAGFSVRDMISKDLIASIPPLTRLDLQKHWKEIVATNYDFHKLSKGSSSGSSGRPVFYYKDSIATSAGQAAHLFGWTLSGWDMHTKGLHIWGNPSTVNNEWKRPASKIKAKLFGHHKFPAYKLVDGQKFYELYELIKRNKYKYLDGYTNAIYLFAVYLQRNNLSLNHVVDYVLTTAENLQDFQRQVIHDRIAPVFDSYGCSEINGIAYECQHCRNYHIIDPHVCVEFGESVDENGPQELLITDLDNFAFPLIRYKNDDLGFLLKTDSFNCPVPFSGMAAVAGRQSDIIRLRDGGMLSVPSFFGSMLLKQVKGLKQYQIEKIENDLIVVNLVKSQEFVSEDRQIIESALEQYLTGKIRYRIRYKDRIDSSPTGKFKLVIDRTRE